MSLTAHTHTHTHILQVLSHVQEVQLYTADADQQAMTMGLRTHALGPTQTSPTLKRPSSSKVSIKEESDSQGQSRQPCLASHTHCSASSLQDVTAAPDAATVTRLACKMHEVTADSEEVKRGSGEPGGGSPQSSNPVSVASLGPCRMSSTQRYQSGELQTASAGQSHKSFSEVASAACFCTVNTNYPGAVVCLHTWHKVGHC